MLQFITHKTEKYTEIEGAELALKGGCRWIQLRAKASSEIERYMMAVQLLSLCRDYGAMCIIDDQVELARDVCADGVHLGKNDMPVPQARRMLRDNFVIGGTANSFDDIVRLNQEGVDYIGLGPFRFTETKQNLSPILGIEGYTTIMTQCREAGITLPIVAIGGIEINDIPALMQTGIRGIALSGTILRGEDPAQTTEEIIKTIAR